MQKKRVMAVAVLGGALALALFFNANTRLDELVKLHLDQPNHDQTVLPACSSGGYRVQPGDSLWSIASAHGVSVGELVWANGLASPDLIQVGSTLTIPENTGVRHHVQAGETISSIAARYRVSAADLAAENGLSDPDCIVEGMELVVPTGALTLPDIPRWGVLEWPVLGPVTSGFGMRNGRPHKGIDIAADEGTLIRAARAGSVRYAAPAGTFGLLVILEHGDGLETYYAHCSELLVKDGEDVGGGQPIARVGNTGHSNGPHLHFEVRWNGQPYDPALSLPGAPSKV